MDGSFSLGNSCNVGFWVSQHKKANFCSGVNKCLPNGPRGGEKSVFRDTDQDHLNQEQVPFYLNI